MGQPGVGRSHIGNGTAGACQGVRAIGVLAVWRQSDGGAHPTSFGTVEPVQRTRQSTTGADVASEPSGS